MAVSNVVCTCLCCGAEVPIGSLCCPTCLVTVATQLPRHAYVMDNYKEVKDNDDNGSN